jgi:signal transduction histidine kinase
MFGDPTEPAPAGDEGPLLLRGPGEVRALMRAYDWSSTPLGAPDDWAPSLRAIVRVMLTSRFAMWMAWGPELTFLCNDAYLPTVGLKRDWVIGSRSDKVWAEIWPDIGPRIQHVLQTGEATWDEALGLYLERNGFSEETYHTFSYSPLADDAGATTGMLCVVAEVTERVIGERQLSVLRDVGATLAAASTRVEVMEGLETGLAGGACDLPFALVFLADREGLPQRAALHDPDRYMASGASHVDLTAAAAWPLAPVVQGAPVQVELEAMRLGGAPHAPRQALISAIAGAEGEETVGYLIAGLNPHLLLDSAYRGFIELLTAQVAAAVARADEYERAREEAERVQLALDAGAIIGTWIWSIPDNQVVGDERFARSFSLDPARCRVGLPLEQAMASIHEDDWATVASEIGEALRRGGPYRCEFRVRQHDGVFRWVEANGRVEQDEEGAPIRFPGVLIDIDHRRAIEAALRDLNQDLEHRVQLAIQQREQAEDALRQAQKMEAVGQLTGGIAHDFNNLLTGISGSLQMLEARIAQGRLEAVPRYVDAAQGATKRAAALTQRLLAFSRRQTLDPKPTNLNRLITDMEELVRRTTGPNIEVEVVGAVGLWPVMIDQNQLENALLNLCINARDAMPDGGRLTIETANRWLDAGVGMERDLAPGQYVSLCVTDTGIGMSKETIGRIFEPFFTTKPLGQGTGLGLSMTYGFVRQSNGQVRVYSEPGRGTTMCLYLPRQHGEAPDSEPTKADRVGFETGYGETVLVIDDEPTVRLLVVDVLQGAGYRVLEAPDGPAGLKTLQTDVRIDLLVTDVGLPGGMNGRQVADAGRALRPQLKVLFITGYAENAVVGNGHLEPGMQVITKPFGIDAFAHKVRVMIDG